MPANPKYLTKSKTNRFAKFTAGFLGGYILTHAIHILIAHFTHKANVIATACFTSFLLWAILFILAYIPDNGWLVWIVYISISAVCIGIVYIF